MTMTWQDLKVELARVNDSVEWERLTLYVAFGYTEDAYEEIFSEFERLIPALSDLRWKDDDIDIEFRFHCAYCYDTIEEGWIDPEDLRNLMNEIAEDNDKDVDELGDHEVLQGLLRMCREGDVSERVSCICNSQLEEFVELCSRQIASHEQREADRRAPVRR
jgi:hypothetical protein